jgi:hypothetical protein
MFHVSLFDLQVAESRLIFGLFMPARAAYLKTENFEQAVTQTCSTM